MPPWVIPAAISALVGLFARGGGGGGGTPDLMAMLPELRQLLALEKARSLYTRPELASYLGIPAPPGARPLEQAVVRLAFALLPNIDKPSVGPSNETLLSLMGPHERRSL